MKYMGSKNRIAKHLIPIMVDAADDANITTWVEPFCLKSDTVVYTSCGSKRLEDLQVGDFIYDDKCQLQKVTNKVLSKKTVGLRIKTKGNVYISTTGEHKFYLEDGEGVAARDLKKGQSLLMGSSEGCATIVIDLAKYVIKPKVGLRGSRGGKVYKDKVKLWHNSPLTDRYIKVDEDFCWALGLIIAEGSRGSITLHKKEMGFAERFIKIYENITGIDFSKQKKYTFNENKNSLSVAVPLPKLYETIFFTATGIGHGARNKNMSFAFRLDKKEVLSLLKGMNDGDGCIRVKNEKYFSWNYKTSSETLAEQMQTIMAIKLGIKSTLSKGVNKVRFMEGRRLDESSYCNICVSHSVDFNKLTKGVYDFDIKKENSSGYRICSIENDTGVYYDITLQKGSTHKFIIQGGIVTHNCGGGNMIDKVPDRFRRVGYDYNEHAIMAMLDIRDRPIELPDSISEEYYKEIKGSEPKSITSWLRFIASFGGKFECGLARGKSNNGEWRNYVSESKRNALKQSPNIQGVEFIHSDYKDLDMTNSLIYCDPPYKSSTGYVTGSFNHNEFFDWCRDMKSKGNIVFVSEYDAPDDFECVWQGVQKTNFASNRSKATHNAVEKLFTLK